MFKIKCGDLEIKIKCRRNKLIEHMNLVLSVIELLITTEILRDDVVISWERD